ncbi:ferritin-like domain-containing protein [Actinomycetospora sp. NBRC 106375]|uniref:ferritin-like domain-containing protein n=1 Tax=Actinomycetospora sp. NBRC 106375 TaxID=3032207 RepID=UPI0025579E97|nr:ferritin-like domain-containing protein [Actinomycetospora sp. NBRC 106375]
MSTKTDMIAQLRAMLQLTQAEIQVARIRVAQARTEAVRKELTENARNAERRTEEITRELQRLGGVADVVSPLVGRVGAVVKSTVEQAGPVDDALLGDLTLEHQLRDRAVYLRSLAESAKDTGVRSLADRLEKAHSATIAWLTTVLAEHALGGPPAIQPTPVQMVIGGASRAVRLPVDFAREQVSRWAARLQQRGDQVRAVVTDTAGRAARLGEDARDVVTTGRDAALNRAEQVSRREGNTAAADALHEARTRLGALQASELPIRDYDGLGVNDAVSKIKQLDEVEDLNKVIVYEEANKNRSGVVSAAQTRHAALAQEVAGVR